MAVATAALAAALTIPVRAQVDGVSTNRDLWPSVEELRAQLAGYRTNGTVLVETDGLPFPDYYSHAVLAELSRRGVPFQVTTDTMVAQLGDRRRADGSTSEVLVVRQGPHAPNAPPGATRIAFVEGGSAVPSVAVYRATPEHS
jgi:hypothetical protein